MEIPISVRITTTPNEFEKLVLKEIRIELNKIMAKVARKIELDISQRIIKQVYVNSPEYEALVNGPLDAHFGIPSRNVIQALDNILEVLQRSVKVTPKRVSIVGKNIRGGLRIEAIRSDFEDVLSLPDGFVFTKEGDPLHWLSWLLTEGDSIIISDYAIEFGSFTKSRSGKAIMVKNDSFVWKVPAAYSGTIRRNWLTRMISDSLKLIEKQIEASIKHNIGKAI